MQRDLFNYVFCCCFLFINQSIAILKNPSMTKEAGIMISLKFITKTE